MIQPVFEFRLESRELQVRSRVRNRMGPDMYRGVRPTRMEGSECRLSGHADARVGHVLQIGVVVPAVRLVVSCESRAQTP